MASVSVDAQTHDYPDTAFHSLVLSFPKGWLNMTKLALMQAYQCLHATES